MGAREMEVQEADVLVIGSGGAGVMAAVEAERAGASVIVASKEPLGFGDTRIALGIMSTSPDTAAGDTEEAFVEDLLRGGEYLNDPKLARALVGDAMDATLTLEGFGHIFSRDPEGILRRMSLPPGGHRASRAIHSPHLGVSMSHSLRAAVARANIGVLEETVCSDLLVKDGEVVGAAALRMMTGEPVALLAKSTVVAAGGGGSLYYPHTDCMPSVVGDSFGLGLRAGAELVDMEQVQFLPFGITHPPALLGIPCGEPSMAGPLGRLLNNKGEVVLENIMPMTRAQVARVIVEEIRKGGATKHGGLLLDLTPNKQSPDGEFFLAVLKEFAGPFLDGVRRAYGKAAADFEEPWDALPTAHYNMGGIKTDTSCRSRVAGLYACGQAQGGVMGGNRLGSTSLTEIFVFGKRAGRTAAAEATGRSLADQSVASQALDRLRSLPGSKGSHRPVDLKRNLQRLMWNRVGPLRDGEALKQGMEGIELLKEQARDLRISDFRQCNQEITDAIELPHMLAAAEAIALSARERCESRGAHVRSDFPDHDEANPVQNVLVELKNGTCRTRCVEAGE
jgi:succinate dehydrogenase/fumarate reductase flavoprotein subunit